jgi:hypothetical protein
MENSPAMIGGILPMTSTILRQIWFVIEETHASLLLKLSDTELLQQLILRLTDTKQLSTDEVSSISIYINSRLPLIRDLASARLESQ